MRVGQNPNKAVKIAHTVASPPGRVATVITHLPNLEGYHAQRLEVVQYSLTTLREGAPCVPVLVWDNGSCPELIYWLRNEYKPDYLILSANVGKFNARSHIWRMFPDKTIIATADDDMGYKPDWFTAQISLLGNFPNVGPDRLRGAYRFPLGQPPDKSLGAKERHA